MTLDRQNAIHAADTARRIRQSKEGAGGVLGAFWGWVNGVASGIAHFISHTVSDGFTAVRIWMTAAGHLFDEYYRALWRALTWFDRTLLAALRSFLLGRLGAAEGRERRDFAYLLRLIYVTSQAVLQLAAGWVRRERTARRRQVAQAEARARAEVRLALQTVQREAASGYRTGYPGRVSVITSLLGWAVERDPLLKDAAAVIVRGLLDFAAIDNPVARLAVGFALRDVIGHLGVDKPLGDLVASLLGPLIGDPRPHDLHGVIADLSDRTGRLEAQWAGFMRDGGPQVEQAGESWRDIAGLAGDAAILAFVGGAVADPAGWAGLISGTLGRAGDDIVTGISDLIRKA